MNAKFENNLIVNVPPIFTNSRLTPGFHSLHSEYSFVKTRDLLFADSEMLKGRLKAVVNIVTHSNSHSCPFSIIFKKENKTEREK